MNIPEDSIFLILNNESPIDWRRPWNRYSIRKSIGSGFCVELNIHSTKRKLIVTNEHCIRDSKNLYVIGRKSSTKYKASIFAIMSECDLALIDVDDKEFWKNVKPLEIGPLPNKAQTIYAMGYPHGRNNISITKGIISRIILESYTPYTEGMLIQVDVPINPGNSGGPVLNNKGQLVGVVQSVLREASNISFIIPNFFILFMAQAICDNRLTKLNDIYSNFTGFSHINIYTQSMHNQTIKKMFSAKNQGMLITYSTDELLRSMDVVIEICNKPVNADQTMSIKDVMEILQYESELSDDEVVHYSNLIGLLKPGEIIDIKILRNNKILTIKHKLTSYNKNIYVFHAKPQWYVLLGVVFTPVNMMLINQALQDNTSQLNINHLYSASSDSVCISELYESEYTEDFPPIFSVVATINNQYVKNFEHMIQLIDKLKKKSKFLIFTFTNTPNLAIFLCSDLKYSQQIAYEYNIHKLVML